jgi:hypothetical protein
MSGWPWMRKSSSSTAVAEPVTIAIEPITEPLASVAAVIKETIRIPAHGPARKPVLNDEEMAEYIRVSKGIGIDCCSDLVREKLLHCLHDEHIHIYNNAQVVRYLDHKLGDDWEWRGLRSVDAKLLAGWRTGPDSEVRRVRFSSEPYRGAVPLPVLLTVDKIQAAVPEVYFYVSAPKNDDGDPFLAVTSKHLGMYIVERWDEPNFRER